MMKKRIILVATILIVIILIVAVIIIKPKYELNKAVEYIKEGKYNIAYTYISSKRNESNIKIIKELITMKLSNNMIGGMEQITTICTKGVEILNQIDTYKIDYSLDDNLNIYVKKLDDYVKVKDNITKEMIIEDMHENYDLYFEILDFVHKNFCDILNNIQKTNFANEVSNISAKFYTIAVNTKSIEDNYNFSPIAKELFNEIQ